MSVVSTPLVALLSNFFVSSSRSQNHSSFRNPRVRKGFLMCSSLFINCLIIAFYVKNLWGIGILKNSIIGFLSGSRIPLAFMPNGLRICLEYLPFASMSYTPVMIYMGKYGVYEIIFRIGLQILWAVLLYGLSKLIWFGAIKKLCVQGG